MGTAQREELVSPRVGVKGYREVFTEEKTFEPRGSVAVAGQRWNGKIYVKWKEDPEQKSRNMKIQWNFRIRWSKWLRWVKDTSLEMVGAICKTKEKLIEIRNYTKGSHSSGNNQSCNHWEPLVAYLLGNGMTRSNSATVTLAECKDQIGVGRREARIPLRSHCQVRADEVCP